MENDAFRHGDERNDGRVTPVAFVRTVLTVAIVTFALLVVADGDGLLPIALGIVGLSCIGAALMALEGFRAEWLRAWPAGDDAETADITASVPLLLEAGVWGLGALYVIRLVEIARG